MLKTSRFAKRSLLWWYENRDSIDLEPTFQRKPQVWSTKHKANLIDSILNGFDIPEIYIADFTSQNIPEINRKKKKYAVIDGKQRLTAIFEFFSEKLPLAKAFVYEQDPMLPGLGKLKFGALKKKHPNIARIFETYALDVKAIETDDPGKLNDVFLRLNVASHSLNGPEIRNAIIGVAVEKIRQIAKERFFVQKIRFRTDRSQERNAAAKILFLEWVGGPAELKKIVLNKFVIGIGEKDNAKLNRAERRVRAGLTRLGNIFRNNDALLGAQGHLPLYYFFITRLKAVDLNFVRPFLENFESRRVGNRNRASGPGDQDLNDYDLASRSTNDKSSVEERLRLLRKQFAVWKRTQRG